MPAQLCFATPRKLPRARDLDGRVVVLDVAFASEASGSGFEKITKPLIDGLGSRLIAWVDHHDHLKHVEYAADPRFVLATKAQHGACPEMVTPELVARVGQPETIVCHGDLDGLYSAAKWMREGVEPYEGADDDARAIDTRIGTPSAIAQRLDRALRARYRDHALFGLVVRHLTTGLRDASLWQPIDEAGRELDALEKETRKLAEHYVVLPLSGVAGPRTAAFVDAGAAQGRYDKTLLLLMGQERADIAVLVDRDTMTLAAPFDSGHSFLALLGLSGGMPTLVSIHKDRLTEALTALGASPAELSRIA